MPADPAHDRVAALRELDAMPGLDLDLPDIQGLSSPAAKALRDWIWAAEMSPQESSIFGGMSASTLQSALLNGIFHPQGCEPGEAGRAASSSAA